MSGGRNVARSLKTGAGKPDTAGPSKGRPGTAKTARTKPAVTKSVGAKPAEAKPAKAKVAGDASARSRPVKATPGILAIDIGGTGLKCAVIDDKGNMLTERARIDTPHPCPPAVLLDAIAGMANPFPAFNRIAIGFPGVVRDGTVLTAPNLGTRDWAGFALADAMSKRFGGTPARLINDAEMQGLGIVSGKGLELVMTLGTGVGTALFRDGALMPHMELAHHPISGDKTYDEYLGNAAYEAKGKKRWNKRVEKVIGVLYTLLHYDRLYLGGGNDKHVEFKLPANVTVASNDAGLTGGAKLWKLRG